jgi:hypothetical protein
MQNQLIAKYEAVCKQIIEAFEKKHDCCFEFWLGDYCSVASFGECWIFNMPDIMFDLETAQPKGLIFKWANDDLDYNGDLATFERQNINFRSYAMGLRFGQVKQENFLVTENE